MSLGATTGGRVQLANLSRAFSGALLDPARLLEVVAREVAALVDGSCTLRLLSEDGKTLNPVAAHHADPELLEQIKKAMNETQQRDALGMFQPVIDEGKTLRMPLALEALPGSTTSQEAFIRNQAPRHLLMVPLSARGRVIGAATLCRYNDLAFTADDEIVYQDLAGRAALAIDASRLLAAEREARRQAELELDERHRAEANLRRSEEQLRQSQKMDAIGQLAGGVAHDFNNLLSVILSFSSLLIRDLKAGDPMRADLEEIRSAGERAAALTRQLLAFSRQQVLEPKIVNLNDVIVGMEKMLQRLLGEDTELVARPFNGLGSVKVDVGQMEQVLVNLAVNARDAMPNGGKLTIDTGNVELDAAYARDHVSVTPGPHVMMAVSDTGTGMTRATQARMFEPFFTTKEKGKGTGLGLSTVFGIVKQSGGNIFVYSELGRGTTIKLYFPRTDEAGVAVPPTPPRVASPRSTETILLVEDEKQVLTVARGILRREGYRVLEARSGPEAIVICKEHRGPIHLLLTDVVMPQMSGRELAEHLAPLRPEMRVLYMSGYTDHSIVHHGVLDPGIAFLQKPITPDALTQKIRDVLASVPEAAAKPQV